MRFFFASSVASVASFVAIVATIAIAIIATGTAAEEDATEIPCEYLRATKVLACDNPLKDQPEYLDVVEVTISNPAGNEQDFALESENRHYESDDLWFWIYFGMSIVLVLLAGVFSGLTLGLLSLDMTTLKVLINVGGAKDQKYAKRIMPLVRRHHMLLVTLLLSNAACMEALPLAIDRIASPVIAIVVSVTAVLFFGEIIPQALCSRYGLAIGANFAWFVAGLMILLSPISWPIGKLLDILLGHSHSTFYRRSELSELINLHGQDQAENEEQLTTDEVNIIRGALEMSKKTVESALIPLETLIMLDSKLVLDEEEIRVIFEAGHTRFPIYSRVRENVIGLLLLRDLILVDASQKLPIEQLKLHPVIHVPYDKPLYDMLSEFRKGLCHMAIVHRIEMNEDKVIGALTLEDILEELMQSEILDENDTMFHVSRVKGKFYRVTSPTSPSRKTGSDYRPLQQEELTMDDLDGENQDDIQLVNYPQKPATSKDLPTPKSPKA